MSGVGGGPLRQAQDRPFENLRTGSGRTGQVSEGAVPAYRQDGRVATRPYGFVTTRVAARAAPTVRGGWAARRGRRWAGWALSHLRPCPSRASGRASISLSTNGRGGERGWGRGCGLRRTLWIPAFAGMTVALRGYAKVSLRGNGPSTGSGRTGRFRRGSGLRRNDRGRRGGPSTGSGRTGAVPAGFLPPQERRGVSLRRDQAERIGAGCRGGV